MQQILGRCLAVLTVFALVVFLTGCSGPDQKKKSDKKGGSSSASSGSYGSGTSGDGGGGFSSPPPIKPRKSSGGGGGISSGGSSGGGGSVKEDAPLYAAQQESAILGCTQSCTRQATEYAVDHQAAIPSGSEITETCEYHCECSFNQIANSIPYDDYRRAQNGQDSETLGAIQGIVDGCASSAGAYWIDPALSF